MVSDEGEWRLGQKAERGGYEIIDEYDRVVGEIHDPESAIGVVRAMRGFCTRTLRAEEDRDAAAQRLAEVTAERDHLRALIIAADTAVDEGEGVSVEYYLCMNGKPDVGISWDEVVARAALAGGEES